MCQNCFNTLNPPTTTTTTNTNTNASTTTTNASSSTTMTTVATVSMNKMLKVHHRSSASSFRSAISMEVSSEDVVVMAAAVADRVRSDGFGFRFRLGSEVQREVNRCFGCRRKVGLTGFWCRCSELFCAEHRYTNRMGELICA